jgi:hypothetical protein
MKDTKSAKKSPPGRCSPGIEGRNLIVEQLLMEKDHEHETSAFKSWVIVCGAAVSFFLWGLLVFYSVGEKGPPAWDFGVVADIPGESIYSTHSARRLPVWVPGASGQAAPARQHIMKPGVDAAATTRGARP